MCRDSVSLANLFLIFLGEPMIYSLLSGVGGGGVLGAVAALVFSFFPNVSISGNMYL